MNNKLKKQDGVKTVKDLVRSPAWQTRFEEILGGKASAFLASLGTLASMDRNIQECDPMSVMTAAMIAATLDLPIDRNLGFSAIIPYREKGTPKAQFQIMTRGFIQLAQRTGQYQTINVTEVYKDELKSYNPLTGDVDIRAIPDGFRDQEQQDKIIGYAAYFRLINGFEKAEYWPNNKIDAHGKRYSKTFDNPYGPWQTNREAMRSKTVLKNTLKHWGILSTDMQLGLKADQGAIRSVEGHTVDVDYVDSTEEQETQPDEKEEPKEKPKEEPKQESQENTQEQQEPPDDSFEAEDIDTVFQ